MTRFYMTLNEQDDITEDETGVELPDLAAARELALDTAREIMCSDLALGRLCLSSSIDIADHSRAVLMTVPFRDAVTVVGA